MFVHLDSSANFAIWDLGGAVYSPAITDFVIMVDQTAPVYPEVNGY